MTQKHIIAIDAMGGDDGVASVIPGVAMAFKAHPDLGFLLFGDEGQIQAMLAQHSDLKAVSVVHHTDHKIASDEKPSAALRASKGSSMRMAIEAVKNGEADAIVSAGNTGALMALAKMVLKPLTGIHRPALASVFPTKGSDTIMLDLGANVLVDAENLVQFAVLGSVFAKVRKNIDKPTVGLLNVGTEEMKGPDHVRAAAAVLSEIDFPGHYKGFVEGSDITNGSVDVVVSDGYAGNIALKTAEGVGSLTNQLFKEHMTGDPLALIGSMFAYFALKRLKAKVDPRRYNGGVFLGLNGLCVKSHGGCDALAFSSAVSLAATMAKSGYVKTVVKEINALMNQETFLSQDI